MQIIPKIDCLKEERLLNLGASEFQNQILQQPLNIPSEANDFYCIKNENGFELVTKPDWLINYLEKRKDEHSDPQY